MASLKKPVSCSCGSIDIRKEWKPERWICNICSTTISERGQRNDTSVCCECGAKRDDVPFRKGKNTCLECYRKYAKEYRDKNRDKIKLKRDEWVKNNHSSYRTTIREYAEKDMSHWLASRMASIKRVRLSMEKGTIQSKNPARLDVQIDLGYLLDLYKQQSGKCVITGLVMTCKHDCHFAASVDRKDNSVGYVPGNVQLVCQAVNMAKNRHSNESILGFFEEFARLRVSGSQCRCHVGLHDSEVVECPLHWSEAIRSRMVDDVSGFEVGCGLYGE